jgi:nicotinamide mononucleotide (NMN) deamidase PncC
MVIEETIAEEVARILVQREMKLGTVECGVNGIVSHRLFEIDAGVDVLGNSLIVDDVEEAIGLMALPRPQFKNRGDFSAKAARAGAREGRAFLGVHICLAVWARGPITDEDVQTVHLAVHNGRDVFDNTVQVGGDTGAYGDWLVSRALEMVREALG